MHHIMPSNVQLLSGLQFILPACFPGGLATSWQGDIFLGCPCPLSLSLPQQRAKAESLDRWLQKQLSDYSAPPVMSYVQTAMAVTDLEKSIKAWQRRAAIAEVSEAEPGTRGPGTGSRCRR